jgi:heme oxygenase
MNMKPAPLIAYISRIEELANAEDPSPLLAHSYVRYLGDLSGGQTIRHTVSKAYDLDEASGLGLSFFAFKSLRSQNPANQGEMKRIKEWFREGLNTAGNLGVNVKGEKKPIIDSDLLTVHQHLSWMKRTMRLT